MAQIPRTALLLGLAGLIPFLWGSATARGLASPLDPAWTGTAILRGYGTIILSFMSGVIWGFAAKAEGRPADAGYLLSVLPAIYALALLAAEPQAGLLGLAFGFAALLAVDLWAVRMGLAPGWWMRLRLLLTTVVLVCLGLGATA
ncbi:DUF3429 family protein [Rhodobacterales bacterium HKCCE3408]|nr:DUF3429 family protein [Rhodobacterales bacterium HKCCE3408]